MQLPRYSIGMGDRFAHQAKAQLSACMLALAQGVEVVPVWNKSNREHLIIGSKPSETQSADRAAVTELGWTQPFFLDADHITIATFAGYVASCNYFTIDVAETIGTTSHETEIRQFVERHPELQNEVAIPGLKQPLHLDESMVEATAKQFLAAVRQAARIYRAIEATKAGQEFVAEISMDETDRPQTPAELLIILAAISDENIPIQTIAPKFVGRFNKGVDYVGNVDEFAKEFRDDIVTIRYAIACYGLPANLKLSVHSGSDKFSLYPSIHEALNDLNAGIHVKTAGTTWLEEIIGLAEAGGSALELACEIYEQAYNRIDELCEPYATVIDIERARLPLPLEVRSWTSERYVNALRHDPKDPAYNPDLRQLLHVGFKIAATMGTRYTDALRRNAEIVGRNVTQNLYERHIRPIFLG